MDSLPAGHLPRDAGRRGSVHGCAPEPRGSHLPCTAVRQDAVLRICGTIRSTASGLRPVTACRCRPDRQG
ncbi:hypothetical protein ASZ90_009063 [hydrocarbon metagenome]|uniref:Uncharacterized protein n=1 Tax=hydrocarbon metagenome TaxID=938273 RepID=A0A0W8FK03_9ZZZZ